MCHVASILNRHPLDLWDGREPGPHTQVGDLVVLAVEEQGLDLDVAALLPSLPVLESADESEFRRTFPRRSLTRGLV